MINTYIVSGMVRMLSKTSEAIETLVQTNIQVPFDSFEEMLLDELHQLLPEGQRRREARSSRQYRH